MSGITCFPLKAARKQPPQLPGEEFCPLTPPCLLPPSRTALASPGLPPALTSIEPPSAPGLDGQSPQATLICLYLL